MTFFSDESEVFCTRLFSAAGGDQINRSVKVEDMQLSVNGNHPDSELWWLNAAFHLSTWIKDVLKYWFQNSSSGTKERRALQLHPSTASTHEQKHWGLPLWGLCIDI